MRSPDRRARQRLSPQERTDAILAAATSAFTSGTYDEVSVAAVAHAAGCRVTTHVFGEDALPGLLAAGYRRGFAAIRHIG